MYKAPDKPIEEMNVVEVLERISVVSARLAKNIQILSDRRQMEEDRKAVEEMFRSRRTRVKTK